MVISTNSHGGLEGQCPGSRYRRDMTVQDSDVLEPPVAQLQGGAKAEHAGAHNDNLALFIHPRVRHGMGRVDEVVSVNTDSQESSTSSPRPTE